MLALLSPVCKYEKSSLGTNWALQEIATAFIMLREVREKRKGGNPYVDIMTDTVRSYDLKVRKYAA